MTIADLLAAELRRDGARPLLTWYDDATGARVELSVATTANWVAKTANWLQDERDVGPGSRVLLRPPDHWLTVVAALATWSVGAVVDLTPPPANDPAVELPGDVAGFPALVLPQPDVFGGAVPPDSSLALVAAERQWTAAELTAAARHAASAHGLAHGSRVLSTMALDTVDGLDATLLAPLAAGGSVVMVANADPAKLDGRARSERVTHTLT